MLQKVGVLAFGLFVACFSPLFSQPAEQLDSFFSQNHVSREAAAYAVSRAAGLIGARDDLPDAVAALSGLGLDPSRFEPWDHAIRMDEYAYFLMLAYDMPGGFMFSLCPGPRYAIRQLRHEFVLADTEDPSQLLPPHRAVRILERVDRLSANRLSAEEE